MKQFLLLSCLLASLSLSAQVGIGNTDPKAALDVSATSMTNPSNTDGILIPRINEFPASNPGIDQEGMLVFITGNGSITKGIYYWNNSLNIWVNIKGAEKIDDLLDGVSNSVSNSLFLGDNSGSSSTGSGNTAVGISALSANTSGIGNVAVGNSALASNTIGHSNIGIGLGSLANKSSGNNNISIGSQALGSNTTGSSNVAIGDSAGYSNTGTGNVFLGNSSGSAENGNNRLYIENSANDSNSALIYGEFDNGILRTNGEFQIGNPSTSGYSFPTSDGSNNQILSTDGSGNLNFIDVSTLQNPHADWYEVGTTNPPDDINDNIYTQGNVAIGQNSSSSQLGIGNDSAPNSDAINVTNNRTQNNNSTWIASNEFTTNISGTGTGTAYNIRSTMRNTPSETAAATSIIYSASSSIDAGSSGASHILYHGTFSGSTGDGARIGSYLEFIHGSSNPIVGSGDKIGYFVNIPSGAPGIHRGIYSDVRNSSGYAAYLIGRLSLGSSSTNRYILPLNDGSSNQVMATDGSGQVSFVDASSLLTSSDDQNLSISGHDLTIEDGNTVTIPDNDTTYDGNDFALSNQMATAGQFITGINSAGMILTATDQDSQNLTLSGTDLSIEYGNTVDLSFLQDGTGTDDQNLTLTGTTLSIEDGNSINLNSLQDGTGTDDQNLTAASLSGTTLNLGIEDGIGTSIDLSSLQDGTGTDDQNLTLTGTTLSIEDGNSVDLASLSPSDVDWLVTSTSTIPADIIDNIYTLGKVSIGDNDSYGDFTVNHSVNNDGSGDNLIYNNLGGNASDDKTMLYNSMGASGSGNRTGMYNLMIGNGSGIYRGMLNYSYANVTGDIYGMMNIFEASGGGNHYGSYSMLTGSGSGNKYGTYNSIDSSSGGTHYGIYSSATKSNSYAGYFIGRLSLGESLSTGRYLMPAADGTSGQIMATDGAGTVSFVNASTVFTDNDDQNIQNLSFNSSTNILTVGIENGTAQNVNLSSLNDTGSDWSINGNNGTTPSTNFIGTIDNQDLAFRTNNTEKVRITSKGQIETTQLQSVWIGDNAGNAVTTGSRNTFVGRNSGLAVTTGMDNTAIGGLTLSALVSGQDNTALGLGALLNLSSGNGNTFIGEQSGENLVSGNYNVVIGHTAGESMNGSSNIFIGFEAGQTLSGSNKLVIDNANDGASSFIYGEMDNEILRANAQLEITRNSTGTISHIQLDETGVNDGARLRFSNTVETDNNWVLYGRADNTHEDSRLNIYYSGAGNIMEVFGDNTVEINGQLGVNINNPTYAIHLPNNTLASTGQGRAYAWTTYSDGRLKSNQETITYGLESLMKLNPKSYFHHQSEFENKKLVIKSAGENTIGFIAQELYNIIPEAVQKPKKENTELWSVDYNKLIPVTVKSIQELNDKVQYLENENQKLKEQLAKFESLEARLSKLENTPSVIENGNEQDELAQN